MSDSQPSIGTNCGWCGRGLPGGTPPLTDRIAALEAEFAAERGRREAAEKDAARYRWLRGDAPTHSERWPRWNLQRWDGRCWHSLERGALDAAIDAAMKD